MTDHPPHAAPLTKLTYVPNFLTEEEEEDLLRNVSASKGWVELSGRRLLNLGGLVTPKGLVPAPIPRWLAPLMSRVAESPAAGFGAGVGGGDGAATGAGAGAATTTTTAAAAAQPNRPPNHALVNLYRPGEGIMPHEDGPAYEPRVAIVSVGSPAVLRFWRRRRRGGGGGGRAAGEVGGNGGDGVDGAGAAGAAGAAEAAPVAREGQGEGQEGGGDGESSSGGGGGAGRTPVPGVDPPDASVLLEPRSLVAFSGEAYEGCYHGIEACEVETIDGSVINPPPASALAVAAADGAAPSEAAPAAAAPVVVARRGDRVSFTIRRVARVRPLLQLSARG